MLDIAVGGMTCASCASGIQRGLAVMPGVESASVNYATGRATVSPDGTLDPEDLDAAITAAIIGLGYRVIQEEDRADLEAATAHELFRRLMVALALTVPLMLLAMVPAFAYEGNAWVQFALATPVIFWAGWPFHRNTLKSARYRTTTMDTLVTMGTGASWLWSTTVLLGQYAGAEWLAHAHVYYETGAVIVTLILMGKWLEARSKTKAGDAIRALGKLQSATVQLEDGTEIDRDDLAVGMRFLARPGSAIATDGRVVDGESAVDTAMVTGESVPVDVRVGDEVVGGTTVTTGSLIVEATKVGGETMLAQIAQMVNEAQGGRAQIQRLADKVSRVFVPAAIGIAAVTLVGWLLSGASADHAFTAAVAVLIIACPCALGLATPLAIMVGTGRGAQMGILIRGGEVLERTRGIDTIVLDKTGTVTEGRMAVASIEAPGMDDTALGHLMSAVASVESRSEHPVARAIAAHTELRRPVKNFVATPGLGVTATVKAQASMLDERGIECADMISAQVRVGARRLFDAIPEELETAAAAMEAAGHTAVFAGRTAVDPEGINAVLSIPTFVSAEAVIAVSDTVKVGAAEAIESMRKRGLDVVLLTGDNARAAAHVGQQVGITTVISEVLPGDKADVISRLQGEGHRVAMVGDGINDAPALAQSDLGIAIGTGTDVAREASDLTVVSGQLDRVVVAIGLAKRTYGIIRGNMFWAFAYNVAAIPLAAFGVLNPMIAAGAMGASSLFVVGNSLRLRSFGR